MRTILTLFCLTLFSTATFAANESNLCDRLVGYWEGKYVYLKDGSSSIDGYEVTKEGDNFKFYRVMHVCPALCAIPPDFTVTCHQGEIKSTDTGFTGNMTDAILLEMKLSADDSVLSLYRS